MSILSRLRHNGGDCVRDGYAFKLRPGRLTPQQIQWLKGHVENLKAEVWPFYDVWSERAAIMEFDGGLSRIEAERLAYEDIEAGAGDADAA